MLQSVLAHDEDNTRPSIADHNAVRDAGSILTPATEPRWVCSHGLARSDSPGRLRVTPSSSGFA